MDLLLPGPNTDPTLATNMQVYLASLVYVEQKSFSLQLLTQIVSLQNDQILRGPTVVVFSEFHLNVVGPTSTLQVSRSCSGDIYMTKPLCGKGLMGDVLYCMQHKT